MKITALKQQIKSPQRVSIFVDDKYGFSLSLDELVKYKLKKDDELSELDLKKYKKLSEDGKLRARALAWVLNRPHSKREFGDYMRRHKAEPELTAQLAEEFEQRKYLDDKQYAKWLVELRGRAGKSSRAMRAELMQKGVEREVIDLVLESEADNEAQRLHQLINKKKNLPRYKNDMPKFIQYLTAQGFPYQLVMRELKYNQPEA